LKLIVLAFVFTTAACNPARSVDRTRTLGVHEVIKNIDELNGKTVRVHGFLGDCSVYDCGLFENEADWLQEQRWLHAVRSDNKRAPDPPDWLGVGGYPTFDTKAQPYNRKDVLISGKVSNQCRYDGKPACTDRASELEPTAIGAWSHS